MARLVRRIGPLNFIPAKERTLFAALTKSVIGQLLSRSAAKSILNRLTDQLPSGHVLIPAEVLELPESTLRSAGLSATKSATVRELARKAVDGVLPGPDRLQSMSDEEIIEEIIKIKGIGRWTVEMLLIFTLGRQDVLPAGDLGVRKGFALTYRRKELPTPKELLAHGEKWRPYRTTATLYLYEAVHVPEPVPGVKLVRRPRKGNADPAEATRKWRPAGRLPPR
jgi:DNA-3-methyladenine glycosylase II